MCHISKGICMLYDDLQELLKSLSTHIQTITSSYKQQEIHNRYQELQKKTEHEEFWKSSDQAKTLKEFQHLKELFNNYNAIVNAYQEAPDLLNLFKDDQNALEQVQADLKKLYKHTIEFKVRLLLDGPDDESNCFLSINAGAGGTESQDWSEILLRMYIRFCEREKFSPQLIDSQPGEGAGIKSATLYIKGLNAYGLLKGEQGIHRLVRISPFDANKRRHTSFAGVMIVPEHPEVDIVIDPTDLRIDTYRAGGAGGQHVNKTESAVRITHLPTNIVVQCQNERSQGQNKEIAMRMLKAKLVQRQKEEQDAKLAAVEKKKIEWGSQIRSYVLAPYKMVKDHRTNHESFQPDLVLDGELIDFIEAYLVTSSSE